MKFYTCEPITQYPNSKFYQSAWCGEGYDTMKDAREHKKFFEKHFGEKFKITKEENSNG